LDRTVHVAGISQILKSCKRLNLKGKFIILFIIIAIESTLASVIVESLVIGSAFVAAVYSFFADAANS
jgi:hypothetical protein